jgi:hypothetical protein
MNILSIAHLRALCARAWTVAQRRKTALVASGLTGGEALVQFGDLKLPMSDVIPVWMRAAAIVSLSALAFYFRWKAGKESGRG